MSAKLMGQVWELDLPHNQQCVLLAYADHGDDDGYNARPGVEYVAWKTGYSERQVQRIVRQLERGGLLDVTASAAGRRATIYRVNIAAGTPKAAYVPPSERPRDGAGSPDAMSPQEARGDIMSGRRGESARGDISGRRGDIQVSPEPEPSQEPTAGDDAEASSPKAGSSPNGSEPAASRNRKTARAADRNNDPEYVHLAELLAKLIAGNRGGRRPKAGDVVKWREPIRLMVERDDLAPDRETALKLVEGAIRWSQRHHFWRKVILSAETLRRQYDQLEAGARAERTSAKAAGNAGVLDRLEGRSAA